jgi:hypothetical protein
MVIETNLGDADQDALDTRLLLLPAAAKSDLAAPAALGASEAFLIPPEAVERLKMRTVGERCKPVNAQSIPMTDIACGIGFSVSCRVWIQMDRFPAEGLTVTLGGSPGTMRLLR